MSGGTFDYAQYRMRDIAERIESEIYRSGRKKTDREIQNEIRDWYHGHVPDTHYYEYPADVIEKFKEAVKIIRTAEIYAQRIDWLLAGDDGEETFINRLQAELKSLDDEMQLKYQSNFKPEYDDDEI